MQKRTNISASSLVSVDPRICGPCLPEIIEEATRLYLLLRMKEVPRGDRIALLLDADPLFAGYLHRLGFEVLVETALRQQAIAEIAGIVNGDLGIVDSSTKAKHESMITIEQLVWNIRRAGGRIELVFAHVHPMDLVPHGFDLFLGRVLELVDPGARLILHLPLYNTTQRPAAKGPSLHPAIIPQRLVEHGCTAIHESFSDAQYTAADFHATSPTHSAKPNPYVDRLWEMVRTVYGDAVADDPRAVDIISAHLARSPSEGILHVCSAPTFR